MLILLAQPATASCRAKKHCSHLGITLHEAELVHFRTSVTLRRIRVGLELGFLRCENGLHPHETTQLAEN